MNQIIALIWAFVLPWGAGAALLSCLLKQRKLDFLTTCAISFALGWGVFGQCMLIVGILGFSYNAVNISLSMIVLTLLCLLCRYYKKQDSLCLYRFEEKQKVLLKRSRFENLFYAFLYTIFWLYVIGYVVYLFWRATNIPIYTWDTFATSAFNAKVLYFERSLDSLKYFIHRSFPLQIPFMITWISLVLEQWDEQFFKLVFPGIFVSFILIYRFFIRQHVNQLWTMFAVFLLMSSNLFIFHGGVAYRDLLLLLYNCSTVFFLLLWKDDSDHAFLILAALFCGFGTFTKLEGGAYMIIHFILLFIILTQKKSLSISKKFYAFLQFAVTSMTIFGTYHFYKQLTGVTLNEKAKIAMDVNLLERFLNIGEIIYNNIFFTANWNLTWFLLVASVILRGSSIKKSFIIKVFLLLLFLYFCLYIAVGLVSQSYHEIISAYTISRLILHFYPLVPILIILINFSHVHSSAVRRSS